MATPPPYFSGFDPVPAAVLDQLHADAHPAHYSAETDSRAIALCFHGFSGMPYEVKPVAKACQAVGLDASVLLWPGHGYAQRADQQRQMAQITKEGLFEAARQEIERARQQYDWVGVFGLSMGGAIALMMASEHRIDACAVAAPCLRLPLQAEILVPLIGWASFCVDNQIQEDFYLPCYQFYHSYAVRELWRTAREARRRLKAVTCPTLAIHTHNDEMVPSVVTDWVGQRVSGPVETLWFDQSGHCMPLDVNGAEIAKTVAQFFKQQVQQTVKQSVG
jgi:carboxylesterase